MARNPDGDDVRQVREYLTDLQARICDALEAVDGSARFRGEERAREGGGFVRPRFVVDGPVLESAAVHCTHSVGQHLPRAATERRPELEGRRYEAASVSLIVHPRNPFVPTTHMNVRFFAATAEGEKPAWWFGGGFDLTPYYGFEEDAVHWHRTARSACEPIGEEGWDRLRRACDDYFYLPHRREPRGIGGIFFDDFDEGGFDASFAFLRSVGDHFLPAYLPVVERRKNAPWTERERWFQLYRRGRYVEFNLLYDRGTRFGIQVGGEAESILASMPPIVRWEPHWAPEPGSREAELTSVFLRPRNWLATG